MFTEFVDSLLSVFTPMDSITDHMTSNHLHTNFMQSKVAVLDVSMQHHVVPSIKTKAHATSFYSFLETKPKSKTVHKTYFEDDGEEEEDEEDDE